MESVFFLIIVVGVAYIVARVILLFEDYLKYKKFIKKEKEYKFSYATYKDFVGEYNNRNLSIVREGGLWVTWVGFGDSSEICEAYKDRSTLIEKSIIDIKTTIVFDEVHMILSFIDLLKVNRFLDKQINNYASYLIERNNVKKWGK